MPDPSPGLSDDDYAALHAFRHEIRRFLNFSNDAANAAGVEPQQHQLLLAVRAAPDRSLRVGEIAERLQVRHHSAVELVNRAVREGLVTRGRSPLDRRDVLVALTARGSALLEELSVHHRRELRRAGPALVAVLQAIISGEDASAASEQLVAETAAAR